MNFDFYLKQQLELHPSMQMQDIIKMCYQATFGVEHMLSDVERAKQYFYREYEATTADTSLPLWEAISDEFCRINLAAWKAKNLDPEELFAYFVASAKNTVSGSETALNNYATTAEQGISEGLFPFSLEEWQAYYAAYKNNGMHPVHHSDAYRQAEQPAYRLVRRDLLDTTKC